MPPTGSTSRIDFIVAPFDEKAERHDAAELNVLELGDGAQTLRVDVEPSRLQFDVASDAEPETSSELLFESMSVDGRVSALMHCPEGLDVRINGAPAGSLSLLNVGDEVQLDDAVLHAVEFTRFEAGPPSEVHIGRICGFCRTPISAKSRVYVHGCNAALHIEDESTPADRRLECALLTDTCPSCDGRISLETGYRELPEL